MIQHTITATETSGGDLDLNVVGIRRENGAFLDTKVLCGVKDSGLKCADRRGRHAEEGGICLDEED